MHVHRSCMGSVVVGVVLVILVSYCIGSVCCLLLLTHHLWWCWLLLLLFILENNDYNFCTVLECRAVPCVVLRSLFELYLLLIL